jgi:phage-related holin
MRNSEMGDQMVQNKGFISTIWSWLVEYLSAKTPLLVTSIVGILAPIQSIMIAAGVLIIFDLVTGVWRAAKKKEKITSNGLRRTISKMVAYQLLIVTGFIMQNYLMANNIPVVNLLASFIAVTEGMSIIENLEQILNVSIKQKILEKIHGIKDQEK